MPELMTDAELVRSARTGDASCLGALLERHRADMKRVAIALLGYGPAAEDAVQDAMLTALSALGTLRDPAAAGPWLRAIVRNSCRMQLRRTRPELALDADVPTADSVEQALDRHALSDWVWHSIGRLAEPLQLTLVLRHFGPCCSYAEIAAICGVPVGTVRSRLNEARRPLTTWLLSEAAAAHEDSARLTARRADTMRALLETSVRGGLADLVFDVVHPELVMAGPWGIEANACEFLVGALSRRRGRTPPARAGGDGQLAVHADGVRVGESAGRPDALSPVRALGGPGQRRTHRPDPSPSRRLSELRSGPTHLDGMRTSLTGTRLYVDVQGSELRVRDGHLVSAPTIIALHGGPGFDQGYLRPGLDPLSEHAQMVYPDLRGQGRSDPVPPDTCTLERMADDTVELGRQLGLHRPVLLGHSAGGFVALQIALRHPDFAAALVLCNTAATLAPEPEPGSPSLLERGGPEAAAAAGRVFAGDFSPEAMAAFSRLVEPHYAGPSHPEVPGELFPLSRPAVEVMRFFFSGPAARYDVRDDLGRLRVPTLVIAGGYDWVCPPAAGRRLAAGIPGAAFLLLPTAGHFSFSEEPAQFTQAVAAFLTRLRDGGGD